MGLVASGPVCYIAFSFFAVRGRLTVRGGTIGSGYNRYGGFFSRIISISLSFVISDLPLIFNSRAISCRFSAPFRRFNPLRYSYVYPLPTPGGSSLEEDDEDDEDDDDDDGPAETIAESGSTIGGVLRTITSGPTSSFPSATYGMIMGGGTAGAGAMTGA